MKEFFMGTIMVLCIFLLFTCIGLVNKLKESVVDDSEFQFIVIDSMMTVHNNGVYVGTVKIQGQLDSLLVDYNQ